MKSSVLDPLHYRRGAIKLAFEKISPIAMAVTHHDNLGRHVDASHCVPQQGWLVRDEIPSWIGEKFLSKIHYTLLSSTTNGGVVGRSGSVSRCHSANVLLVSPG